MILLDTDTVSLFHAGHPRVTRNVRHFRLIPGLRVENWAD